MIEMTPMAGILREARKPYITQELYERKKQPYMDPKKWPNDGPVHIKMKEICTKMAVEKLGSEDWEVVRGAFKVGQGV
jgi:asparagine synthase (glutamine-hydrolysing)